MANEDLVTIIINQPLFWFVIILIIAYFILKEYNRGRLAPEQAPDFGVKYRAARVKEHLDKREKTLGEKPEHKTLLFRDINPLGRVLYTELVPQILNDKAGNKTDHQINLQLITFRRFGFTNWLLALLGFGHNRLLVDAESIQSTFDMKEKYGRYTIGRECYFRERGGLLFLSRETEKRFIDEINADKDYENAKGFVSDFPRRLSNLHPAHAAGTDTLELQQALEEKKKVSDRKRWVGGG
jgi:hypothetical protein